MMDLPDDLPSAHTTAGEAIMFAQEMAAAARRELVEEIAVWLDSDAVQDMIPSRKGQALRERFGGPR